MTCSQCPHCLAEIARLDGELAKARAERAEVAEVRRGGVFRTNETLAAVRASPALATLTDPSDPYPAELVGQLARTVIALDAETFDMGSYSLASHYEYKQRRNKQFAAYEALAKERGDAIAARDACYAEAVSAHAERDAARAEVSRLKAGLVAMREWCTEHIEHYVADHSSVCNVVRDIDALLKEPA